MYQCRNKKDLTLATDKIYDLLKDRSFLWGVTPQGFDYWNKISKEILEMPDKIYPTILTPKDKIEELEQKIKSLNTQLSSLIRINKLKRK